MTARALFSIKDDVLERFRAIVPNRERSRVIESFMLKEIKVREEVRERKIEKIARMVETDPAFAKVRGVSADVDAVAGDAIDMTMSGESHPQDLRLIEQGVRDALAL